ncbi:MAG: hypothetical protein NTV34_20270, partial [Proteobacteria bacterium]|nr:hypothetical protein [Pseudomonadota bacterium]
MKTQRGLNAMNCIKLIVFLGGFMIAGTATALVSEVLGYVSQYQIGIDYSNSIDSVGVSYDVDAAGVVPSSCKTVDATKKNCSVT